MNYSYGTSTERPQLGLNNGSYYYDATIQSPIFYDANVTKWRKPYMCINDETKVSGLTTDRPPLQTVPDGFCFFDKTLNKPIWKKDNSEWVDALGNVV